METIVGRDQFDHFYAFDISTPEKELDAFRQIAQMALKGGHRSWPADHVDFDPEDLEKELLNWVGSNFTKNISETQLRKYRREKKDHEKFLGREKQIQECTSIEQVEALAEEFNLVMFCRGHRERVSFINED